jgi:hypothetical protein
MLVYQRVNENDGLIWTSWISNISHAASPSEDCVDHGFFAGWDWPDEAYTHKYTQS